MPFIAPWLSDSAFIVPDWLVSSAWLTHAPFAAWLIEAHRPRTLVELGVHAGYSYGAFCEAIKRNGFDTSCSGVDTWLGDEQAGFYDESVFTRLCAYHDARYSGFSRLIRATFDNAVAIFGDRSIDLLHIDGRHFYEDVRHDFETWRPKLSERAVVLFHDTAVLDRNFGVHRLWKELTASHPHFQFLHGHGLGVLGVGAQQTAPLIALYAAEHTEEGQRVRAVYAHLGRAISDRIELRDAGARQNGAVAAREKEIERLRQLIAAAAVKSMRD